MKAQQLFKQDGSETPVWYCGECGTVYGPNSGLRGETAQGLAEACCKPSLCECGVVIDRRGHLTCDACLGEERKAKEAERFERAEKITPADYDGWVVVETGPSPQCISDGYYDSLDALLEAFEDEGLALPGYVYTCVSSGPRSITVDDILEVAFADSYEDAAECAEGIDALKNALDAFNEANKSILSYSVDYKRAIVLRENG